MSKYIYKLATTFRIVTFSIFAIDCWRNVIETTLTLFFHAERKPSD